MRPVKKSLALTRNDADLAGNPGSTTVISVQGEVDLRTAAELEHRLLAELDRECHRLVLDVGEVDFFGCAGLDALNRIGQRAHQSSCELHVLSRHNRFVSRVLRLSGPVRMFTLS